MLRSLFSSISGLRAHQTMMDVTGNNIANVNTTGFKSSTTVFQDTLSQIVRAAGAPQNGQGGTNPAQVGLGVKLASITQNFAQGAAQTTGRATDLMVQGEGFFVVRAGGENLFTRSGAFSFDTDGRLTTAEGNVVQGWLASGGTVNPNGTPTDLILPVNTLLQPQATSAGDVAGNLPADADVGTTIRTSIAMYDAQGNRHDVSYLFAKTAADTWDLTVSDGNTATDATGTLTFDSSGALTSASTISFTPTWAGAITTDLTGVSQFGGASTVQAENQNGTSMGALRSFSISPTGVLNGVFSNGLKQVLGQVALATFNNPPGLDQVGSSLYRDTVNSGAAQIGEPGTAGRGTLLGGALEMSNVDLGQEFTNLIIAQRGFQANSRVITSSDEILQDLVNLKR